MSTTMYTANGDSNHGGNTESIFNSCSRNRSNRLERFEESLGKLNPPRWMSYKTEKTGTEKYPVAATNNGQSNGENQYAPEVHIPPQPSQPTQPQPSQQTQPQPSQQTQPQQPVTSRYRYSDYRRSNSSQRNPSSYWKSVDYANSMTASSSRPLSREPSPVPAWSRPPTAPAGSRFSRWSASTLSDSAYSGQNTPTDSVVSGRSGFSCKSLADGNSGLSLYNRQQKPYLGWRSQENVSDGRSGRHTPNERLACSLRRSQQSGLDRSNFESLNSGLASEAHGSTWRGRSFSREHNFGPSEWYIRDSIKSVSSAIAEFCKADDVPALPPSDEEHVRRRRSRTRSRDQSEPKSRIVWLESSFVSSTTNLNNLSTKL